MPVNILHDPESSDQSREVLADFDCILSDIIREYTIESLGDRGIRVEPEQKLGVQGEFRVSEASLEEVPLAVVKEVGQIEVVVEEDYSEKGV